MNRRTTIAAHGAMPDVQGQHDSRRIAIENVGIRGLRIPISVGRTDQPPLHTVADVEMSVGLPHDQKGTHMSRFVDMLSAHEAPLDGATFRQFVSAVVTRLEANDARVRMRFPYFRLKHAPVSGASSSMDYEVEVIATAHDTSTTIELTVVVPVTTLCPCSRAISDYGAHNQRSHVTITAHPEADFWIEDAIAAAEQCASAELFSLLKRADEKYLTERAYDNPRFVEDLVRDVAARLQSDERVPTWRVEVENFESIHNHSAWAVVSSETAQN